MPLTRSDSLNSYHAIEIPAPLSDDAATNAAVRRYSPESLLGGFLVGPENRLAELAYRLAVDGVPVFDRPIGATSLDPVETAVQEPSRADVEILLHAAQDGLLDSVLNRPNAPKVPANVLFDMATFNAARRSPDAPAILGYRPLESLNFSAPLVFYGPSGSGKTRIVEGICQIRRTREPQKSVFYLSAADFARSAANAIQRNQTLLFRQLITQAQVLAIEDADILSEKEAAQFEALAALDESIRAQKLVVFSFSRNPTTIPGFLPDLAARFSSGILIPVNLPTEETKRVVVDLVASKLATPLDEETRQRCVQRLPSTIGAICGTLVQAAQTLATSGKTLSIDNLDDFLARRNPNATWTLDRIIKTVAKYFAVSVVEMRSKKRSKTLVLARSFVVFFARKLTNATFREIGRQFSNRDYSTMIHSTRELTETLENDEELQRHAREIARLLDAEDSLSF